MTTVVVEFDGTNFVPQQPVDLPVGTKLALPIPTAPRAQPVEPSRPWEELMAELNADEPYFATVEEALGRSRKYPGYYP